MDGGSGVMAAFHDNEGQINFLPDRFAKSIAVADRVDRRFAIKAPYENGLTIRTPS